MKYLRKELPHLPHLLLLKTIVLFSIFLLASCTANHVCNRWHDDGDFYGTLESCKKCVDTLGSGNKEAVKGCTLGLDATQLLTR